MAAIDDLIISLSDDAMPVRQAAHPLTLFLLWTLVAALYIGGTLLILPPRPDLAQKITEPFFAAEIALLTLIVLTSGLSAVILSFPDLHQKNRLACLATAPLLAFIALMYFLYRNDTAPLPAHGMECLACISLLSLLPAFGIFYTLRKYASVHYYSTGAVALIAAFAVGCLALRLSEQTDSIHHLVQWHYIPMAGFALLGVWLGGRLLKW
jgi:hypothetical protein